MISFPFCWPEFFPRREKKIVWGEERKGTSSFALFFRSFWVFWELFLNPRKKSFTFLVFFLVFLFLESQKQTNKQHPKQTTNNIPKTNNKQQTTNNITNKKHQWKNPTPHHPQTKNKLPPFSFSSFSLSLFLSQQAKESIVLLMVIIIICTILPGGLLLIFKFCFFFVLFCFFVFWSLFCFEGKRREKGRREGGERERERKREKKGGRRRKGRRRKRSVKWDFIFLEKGLIFWE